MTTQPKPCPDMPAEIWLVEHPELDEDDDNRVIWTTDPDVYEDGMRPLTRYVRADTRAADTVEALLEQVPEGWSYELKHEGDRFYFLMWADAPLPDEQYSGTASTPAEAIKRALEGVK